MRNFIYYCALCTLILSSCASKPSAQDFNSSEVIESKELAEPEQTVGSSVEIIGNLQYQSETAEDGYYYGELDPVDNTDNYQGNKYLTRSVVLASTDKIADSYATYLDVTGVVVDITDESMEVAAGMPIVEVASVTPLSQTEALSPTLKAADIDDEQTISDVTVSFDAVEFSPIETRVYVSITNDTNYQVELPDYDANLVVAGKNYASNSTQANDDFDILPPSILAKATATGVIIFPAIEYQEVGNLVLTMSGNVINQDLTPLDFELMGEIN